MGAILKSAPGIRNNKNELESEQAKQNRVNAGRVEKMGDRISVDKLERLGYVVLRAEDFEDLKTKRPEIYNQIYTTGFLKGKSEGKKIANIINEALASTNSKNKGMPKETSLLKNDDIKNGKDFETLVAEYQTEHNCRKGKAIIAIARSHYHEHKRYVTALAEATREKRNIKEGRVAESKNNNFWALVEEYLAEHNCSKTEAMKAIVRSHPDEHAKYIGRYAA